MGSCVIHSPLIRGCSNTHAADAAALMHEPTQAKRSISQVPSVCASNPNSSPAALPLRLRYGATPSPDGDWEHSCMSPEQSAADSFPTSHLSPDSSESALSPAGGDPGEPFSCLVCPLRKACAVAIDVPRQLSPSPQRSNSSHLEVTESDGAIRSCALAFSCVRSKRGLRFAHPRIISHCAT